MCITPLSKFMWTVCERDRSRTKSRSMPCLAFVAFFLLMAIAAPQVRAAPQETATIKPEEQESLEILIVDSHGKPVANCDTEWRVYPKTEDFRVTRGTLGKSDHYGRWIKADENGRVRCQLPISKSNIRIFVKFDGYGPYFAEWDSPKTGEPVPDTFTIKLDDAWTVGGVLVNEDGEPIAGAKASPSLEFKKRVPGQLGIGTKITTNEEGRWTFSQVPISNTDITVSFEHRDYKPFYKTLSRGTFGLEEGAVPHEKIVASKGLSVSGTITNADGEPIKGAMIRTKVRNDERNTTTDAEGKYEMSGFEAETSRIVVSADSYALDFQDVLVKADMMPVDFTLQPGGHVKIRVLDEDGKGIPKSRIFFQRWRGQQIEYFEFDHIKAYTDDSGVWEWDEAPLDTFQADICRPGGMQMPKQPVVARDEEYVFRPPRQLIVTGKVLDAKTKKPIPNFRVVAGIQGRPDSSINWMVNDAFHGKDGVYRMPHNNRGYHAHLVRLEADGYQPKVSRNIQYDEETVEINFDLERGKDISEVVRDVAGNLAVNAEVVLGVAGSQISIDNGRIDDGSTSNAKKVLTDKEGRFQFSAQVEPFHLIVLHENGFAKIEAEPGAAIGPIELEPWAKLKGKYFIGSEPVPNKRVEAQNSRMHSHGQKVPNVFAKYETTTSKDGSFQIDRIPAGDVRVRREIVLMVGQGATEVASTPIARVKTEAGKTTEMQLGGKGVAVVGQLTVPDNSPEADWRQASLWLDEFVPAPPKIPFPEGFGNNRAARMAWLQQWKRTAAGQGWQQIMDGIKRQQNKARLYYATVEKDGTFRFDDVTAGNYRLRGDLEQNNVRLRVFDIPVQVGESEIANTGEIPLQ